jgi:putative oxidoreductase
MKIAAIVARILLGIVFLVIGLNKLYAFIPATMPPGDAGAWSMMMMRHHWMTAVGVFESVGALLLLSGRFVPLGLTLLAPVCVNILLFQILFGMAALVPGYVAAALELFLIYAYRDYFKSLFTAKAHVS